MYKKVLVLFPKKSYVNALLRIGVKPVFNCDESYDGLLLTGGGDISPCAYGQTNTFSKDIDKYRDQFEFFHLQKAFLKHKAVLGVCRGMQVVNVFLGGTLKQHIEMHSQINFKDRTHLCLNVKNLPMHEMFGKSLTINSAHHQAVDLVGKNLSVAALSCDKTVECLAYKNIFLTQFHPERLPRFGDVIFDYFAKLL